MSQEEREKLIDLRLERWKLKLLQGETGKICLVMPRITLCSLLSSNLNLRDSVVEDK
jgi:hypothetical protein